MFLPYLLALLVPLALSDHALDVSQSVSLSQWRCMRGYNFYSTAIVRVYRSLGKVDTNAPATLKNARTAGFKIEGYVFPCYKCGNPSKQATDTMNMLNSNSIQLDRIWIDIEGTQYWSSSKTANANFIDSIIKEFEALGADIGIYTSKYQWHPIVGYSNKAFSKFSKYPLWYAHYDYVDNFNDFQPFGGWTKCSLMMKQYTDAGNKCGMSYDKNYRI